MHRLIRSLNLHYNGIGWQITRENLIKIIPKGHLLWNLWLRKETAEGKCFLRMKCEGLFRDVSIIWE